jgi:hypothetical protein
VTEVEKKYSRQKYFTGIANEVGKKGESRREAYFESF